jgi:hypothetical protein
MCDVNVLRKRVGTILSDDINNIFIAFLCLFYGFNSGTSLSHCVLVLGKLAKYAWGESVFYGGNV